MQDLFYTDINLLENLDLWLGQGQFDMVHQLQVNGKTDMYYTILFNFCTQKLASQNSRTLCKPVKTKQLHIMYYYIYQQITNVWQILFVFHKSCLIRQSRRYVLFHAIFHRIAIIPTLAPPSTQISTYHNAKYQLLLAKPCGKFLEILVSFHEKMK